LETPIFPPFVPSSPPCNYLPPLWVSRRLFGTMRFFFNGGCSDCAPSLTTPPSEIVSLLLLNVAIFCAPGSSSQMNKFVAFEESLFPPFPSTSCVFHSRMESGGFRSSRCIPFPCQHAPTYQFGGLFSFPFQPFFPLGPAIPPPPQFGFFGEGPPGSSECFKVFPNPTKSPLPKPSVFCVLSPFYSIFFFFSAPFFRHCVFPTHKESLAGFVPLLFFPSPGDLTCKSLSPTTPPPPVVFLPEFTAGGTGPKVLLSAVRQFEGVYY